MTGLTLVANKTMAFTSWTGSYSACWHSDSSKLYVAPQSEGKFYIVDLANSFSLSNKTFAAQNNMTVYQMTYSSV